MFQVCYNLPKDVQAINFLIMLGLCGIADPLKWESFPPSCKSRMKTVSKETKNLIEDASSHNQSRASRHGSPLVCLLTDLAVLPFVFEPLPLGSIKPSGWLRDQLQLMADGLPGHQHDFYHIVKDNPWLGGSSEYSPLNEAFPYWFNGLVPLAYSLNDQRLKKQVLGATEYILSHQQKDGWLGPETDSRKRNFWGRYPVFLGLMQLVEADPKMTTPGNIIPAMHRFVSLMHSMLSNDYQGYVWHPGDDFDEQWGRSRAADMVLALQWLYEKYPEGNERNISECMTFFYDQAYDWSYWFSNEDYIKADFDMLPVELTNSLFPYIHVVNAAQGLKSGAVFRRLTKNDDLLNSTRKGVNLTFTYHGTPSGSIVGDERLSGLSPVRGTELCAVVETMFSLSYLYQTIGDNDFADRCERTAFNALPVMATADWWAHQYVAQTNQPISHELSRSPFWNVGNLGQIFGTEPNYPCCAVNHHQGYPKFLSASFVRSGSSGIAHALLGPAEVLATTISGTRVHISCSTNYPFNSVLYYTINSDKDFVFSVRVPFWAIRNDSTVSLNGNSAKAVSPDPQTGMHTVDVAAGTTIMVYQLAADIRVEYRANDTVAVYHGALQYAVSVAGNYSSRPPQNYPEGSGAPPEARDWTITPRSTWAVAIDPTTLQFVSNSSRDERLPNPIFAEDAPPVTISALACEIDWRLTDGYASNPPKNEQRSCKGQPFTIELRPYGAAKLHMAELPTVDLSSKGGVPPPAISSS
jgi:Beta-L-arabinofuranosidase, GH127